MSLREIGGDRRHYVDHAWWRRKSLKVGFDGTGRMAASIMAGSSGTGTHSAYAQSRAGGFDAMASASTQEDQTTDSHAPLKAWMP